MVPDFAPSWNKVVLLWGATYRLRHMQLDQKNAWSSQHSPIGVPQVVSNKLNSAKQVQLGGRPSETRQSSATYLVRMPDRVCLRAGVSWCCLVLPSLLFNTKLLKISIKLVGEKKVMFLDTTATKFCFIICPWCNCYRCRKWTRRHEFKSWMKLIAFHIALIPLGKVWIQLFSLQLWVNSRID